MSSRPSVVIAALLAGTLGIAVAAQEAPPLPPAGGGPPLSSLPPWPAAAGAVPVGGDVIAPRVIKSPKPTYTPDAMRARVQGKVRMEAVVATDGTVRDARVIRSIPLLDEAALETVRQWEFKPATRNGTPVVVRIIVEMDFKFRDTRPPNEAQQPPTAVTTPASPAAGSAR